MTGKHTWIPKILTVLTVLGGAADVARGTFVDLMTSYQPLHWWRLGESSGSTAIDAAGALDGVYHGSVFAHPGAIWSDPDTAVYFDGRSHVEIPQAPSLLLDSGTVHFWFMDTGTMHRAGLFSKDSQYFDSGGHLTALIDQRRVRVRLQSTDDEHWVESPRIELDEWYQVVFTFGAEGMALYLDGDLVDREDYTGGLGSTSGGAGNFEPLVIGANAWMSGDVSVSPLIDHFSGRIDEMAILDYALSPEEVAELYDGGLTNLPEPMSAMLFLIGSVAMMKRRRHLSAIEPG